MNCFATCFGFLFRLGSWSMLKSIGNSYVSIVTVIVPIFGYIVFSTNLSAIALANSIQVLEEWGFKPPRVEGVEFIRLKMTYVGLSLVGLTTIAFQILCPREIKSYTDVRHFSSESIKVSYSDAVKLLSERLKSGCWYHKFIHGNMSAEVNIKTNYLGSAPNVRARRDENAMLTRGIWLDHNEDQLNKTFSLSYDWQNYSNVAARWLILLGFVVGYMLTIIPSLQMLEQPFFDVAAYILARG